jgi:hypothetical protein
LYVCLSILGDSIFEPPFGASSLSLSGEVFCFPVPFCSLKEIKRPFERIHKESNEFEIEIALSCLYSKGEISGAEA